MSSDRPPVGGVDALGWLPGPVLVIAPHPDDEVIGAGGVMALLARRGVPVHVFIATVGEEALFGEGQPSTVRAEVERAHAVLGVAGLTWGSAPAAKVDTVAHFELNRQVSAAIARVRPGTILMPHWADIHLDHRLVFDSVLVACRPHRDPPPPVLLCYEVVSSSHWGSPGVRRSFEPSVFVDISEVLEDKLRAVAEMKSQLFDYPHQRSLEAIRALAMFRGSSMGMRAAEAYFLVRALVRG